MSSKPSDRDTEANRRRFLQYLAASPLLAAGGSAALAETLLPKTKQPDPLMWGPLDPNKLIKSPKEAINVFDLEPVCRQNVPPAHFGYMASGIDDEVTLRRNREDFLKFYLRPRRLVDVSKVDMSVDILGTKYASPIVCAPVGGQRSFHDDAESGVARAVRGSWPLWVGALLLAGLTLVQLATGNRLVRLVLVTTGALPARPVTGGVDEQGRIVIATYPGRAKTTNVRRAGEAAVADRGFEHGDDCRHQPRQLRPGDLARGLGRADPRAPQRLAHVDVAEPRDDPLVEQAQLDRLGLALQSRLQMRGRKPRPQRFWPQRRELGPCLEILGRHQIDRAEPPRIAQGKAVAFGLQQQVIVGLGRFGIDPPAPAHAQMEDHRRPAVEMQQPVFRPARQRGDGGAGHHLYQIGGEGAAQVRAVERYALDPLAFEKCGEPADGGFDFWQFGHGSGPVTPFASAAIPL
mgnify:CR=1 FL=1